MTSAQSVIDQELAQFGWVESIATNSISDFTSPKSNNLGQITEINTSNLLDTVMSHLIFYVIFCYSLFLYIFIDLGFSSFLGNKINAFFKVQKELRYSPLSILNPH